MKKDSRIFIAGESTMEGKALVRLIKEKNYNNVINLGHGEPDLTNNYLVKEYFKDLRPEYVFLFAGKSGGIKANQEMPATLMLDNLRIISNVLSAAHKFEVEKLLYLASSCVYPKHAKQPMRPEMLMTGSLEPTNSAYATAKLAGIELCRVFRKEHGDNFISAIPANIFGPEDDFFTDNSHVVTALIKKMHDAIEGRDKIVEIWGSGRARREFIYVDDLSDACIFLMNNYEKSNPINVGTGNAISIKELAQLIMDVIGYNGKLIFDVKKPDGMPEKILDLNKLFELGWSPSVRIKSGIEKTYDWFKST